MSFASDNSPPPVVQLLGQIEHPDFRDALDLIRESAKCDALDISPELVVVAQSRPDEIGTREIELLQRRWPLAGIVALLGSWCEGETRTGRPWPGVKRFYWYEFPAWWWRQLALRTAGLCPDWSRPTTETLRAPTIRDPQFEPRLSSPKSIRDRQSGTVVLSTANRAIADALADALQHACYATVWHAPHGPQAVVRGAIAGIWDGGQLDDRETDDLAAFCRRLARDSAPVCALLDFPRRDRCELARQLGVKALLGKPWINADLVATIQKIANRCEGIPTMTSTRAA
ncbi:MAG: hypothetical protein L0228_11915 [Planctomycetes bacterium]|nr:hypothetical protein [Planctomycetota bacterium]